MIYQALKLVSTELNNYLVAVATAPDDLVALGNIALFDSKTEGNNTLEDKVIVSLVNLQEEKALKNQPARKVTTANQTEYRNPPVILNLIVLFSVTSSNYQNALIYLSRIISFFQHKRTLTNQNTPIPSVTPQIEGMERFKLIMDLYSPSFEETNYLWGTLGGKQFPSVLYKMRLVELEREDAIKDTRGVIEQIETKQNVDF